MVIKSIRLSAFDATSAINVNIARISLDSLLLTGFVLWSSVSWKKSILEKYLITERIFDEVPTDDVVRESGPPAG